MLHVLDNSLLFCRTMWNLVFERPTGIYITDNDSWDVERTDILQRADWLCMKLNRQPDELIADMPSIAGTEYQEQWAMYSCAMLVHALANIRRIFPDADNGYLETMADLIKIVDSPAVRHYDTIMWGEDAIQSLPGDKSHMAYLGILSWMISNYKLSGGDSRFDSFFERCIEALDRRMLNSRYDLNLLTFPGLPIFTTDMLIAVLAIHNFNTLYDGKYSDTEARWIENAKGNWIHKETGLLASMLPGESQTLKILQIRGAYTASNCDYLCFIDRDFAFEQYKLMKSVFRRKVSLFGKAYVGINEFSDISPTFRIKAGDAGIVVKGLSAAGTALALGAATFFNDWQFRKELLQTAESCGGTVTENGYRHYRLGTKFLVGEAIALAMRTNVSL